MRLYLILTRSDIYINSNLDPLTKSAAVAAKKLKDILSLYISQMLANTVSIIMSLFEFEEKSMKTEATT